MAVTASKRYLDESVFINGKNSIYNLRDAFDLYAYIDAVAEDAGYLTSAAAGGNTIYNSDDVLLAARDIGMGGFDLDFVGSIGSTTIAATGNLTTPQLSINGVWNVVEVGGNLEFQLGGTPMLTIANGDVILNNKLTVPGLIDPTGIIFVEEDPVNVPTGVGKSAVFVADGSGGTRANELYYKNDVGSLVVPIGEEVSTLRSLIGGAEWSADLGIFAGGTIQDNVDIPTALQDLETAVENAGSPTTDFATDTDVGPAAAGEPTLAEIEAWAAATLPNPTTNSMVRYTGTDTAGDPTTYLYWVDVNGDAEELQSPATAIALLDEDDMASDSDTQVPSQQSVKAYVDGEVIQIGAGAPGNGGVTAYKVGQLYFATATLNWYHATTASTNPYTSPAGSVWALMPFGKATQHADATGVGAAITASPTDLEISTWASTNSHIDKFIYYTGNDLTGSPATYFYYVDINGRVDLLRSPGSSVVNDLTTGGVADALSAEQGKNLATALGLTTGDVDYGTFTGTALADNQTAKALFQAIETFLENVSTTLGVALTGTDLGTFTGNVITDNVDLLTALQEIETFIENIPTREQTVVADITARDAQTGVETGDLTYVVDASADATVTLGAALYVWDGAAYAKVAEFESMDLDLSHIIEDWATATAIVDKQVVVSPNEEIYRSDSARTTGGAWNATEEAFFTKLSWKPNNRAFADETTVAPATGGTPLLSEIQTFVTTTEIIDSLVYYTGTDTSTDTPTYVYVVDQAGVATLVNSPSAPLLDEDDMVSDSATDAPSQQSVKAYVDTNIVQVGAGSPADGVTTAAFVGQFYFDVTNRVMWDATTASTNPYAAATGSVWRKYSREKTRVTVVPTAQNTLADLVVPPAIPADVFVMIDGAYDYDGQITVDAAGVVTVAATFEATYGTPLETYNKVSFIYYAD